MDAWVIISVLAAAVQTLRFMLQKQLKGLGLSTGGATFSRFLFAAPLAVAALLALLLGLGQSLPSVNAWFFIYAVIGGLAQILATFCTVALFSRRSFAVGIAFTKTETIQVALLSVLLLGDGVSLLGWLAIIIGTLGVLLLSRPPEGWRSGKLLNAATGLGVLAGALFGLAAIGYRGATLQVDSELAVLRAVTALALATSFQALAMTLWLAWREPGEVARVVRSWRKTALVALTGVMGSAGWFIAFSLQNAAYVRSVGQIELIFSILVSVLVFRERPSLIEVIGMGLLAASIVAIILLG
ncbi:EamA family transporter [Pararhodobacter oceanensis]|uniref:EamA family transporter n=1 Tax=Pararhodobacter oceanensis TaxID=2172121 RepID=UPI003A8EF5A7